MPSYPHDARPETRMMSHGYDPFLSEGAVKPPIFMTSTFAFPSAADGERFFRWAYGLETRGEGETMGLVYSRLNNPGVQIFEERLALWEGAEKGLAFASGMAAITTTLLALLKPGDVVAYTMPIYGGTEYLLAKVLPKFGIETVAFPVEAAPEALAALVAPYGARLGAFLLETPANPTNVLADLPGVAALAKRLTASLGRPVLTIVDNTFLGPVFQAPLRLGADLSLYSATKYIGGHSDVIAGAALGSASLIDTVASYRTILGSTADPFACWLLTRSLETLKLRMEHQAGTASRLAAMLAAHPAVSRVHHPSLLPEGSAQRARYEAQCTGPGAVVAFEIRGGKAEAFRFLDSVKLAKLAVSLGGTETLVEHPATMTHADIPADEQERFGVLPSLVRIAVGLEAYEDLEADLGQALAVAAGDFAGRPAS